MLEECQNDIDVVLIATPDHHHAPAAIRSIHLGKATFSQKPLAHDIYECYALAKAAREQKVPTQMAEFERGLIQERTRAGLQAARARGRLRGRKPLSPDDPRIRTAKALHGDKKMPVVDICRTLQVSRPTLYRWLAMN